MRRVEKEHEALRTVVVSAGHDGKKLKTVNYNIKAEYDRYIDNKKIWQTKFIGYSCEHSLRLEFDYNTKKLGSTLSAITECGAKPKIDMKFSVKDASAVLAELLENTRKYALLLLVESSKFPAIPNVRDFRCLKGRLCM